MLNLDKNKRYLLACSFGPDSMALFHMLLKEGYVFEVAHVNYHLRDEAATETENLIKYCEDNNIKIHVKHEDMTNSKDNIEAKCRILRYKFFQSISKDFDYVLVAHNQDDLLETYIMQKMRKSIVEHFGIKEEIIMNGIHILRPLLNYTKSELQKYNDDNLVPYAIDSSNLEDLYLRNKIRHEIVQKLSKAEREDMIEEINQKNIIRNTQIEFAKNHPVLSAKDFLDLDDEMSAIWIIESNKKDLLLISISMDQVREIKKAVAADKANIEIKLMGNVIFLKEYDSVRVTKRLAKEDYSYIIEKPQILDTPYFYLDFTKTSYDRNVNEDSYPITIRNASILDKIKIKDYYVSVRRLFIDWKMPVSLRNRWPVIVDKNNDVIYIPRYQPYFIPGVGCNFYVKIK